MGFAYDSHSEPDLLWAQIENEYDTIQRAFGESGSSYVKWAGNMALKMNTGVPWVMCKQKDAPGEVVSLLLCSLNLLTRYKQPPSEISQYFDVPCY